MGFGVFASPDAKKHRLQTRVPKLVRLSYTICYTYTVLLDIRVPNIVWHPYKTDPKRDPNLENYPYTATEFRDIGHFESSGFGIGGFGFVAFRRVLIIGFRVCVQGLGVAGFSLINKPTSLEAASEPRKHT